MITRSTNFSSISTSRRRVTVLAFLSALVLGASPFTKAAPAAAASTAAAESPRAALDDANARLKKLFGAKKPSWSPEAEAKNGEIKKIVGSFLDFEELARRSLARHWDGLSPKQRADFVKTLRELVERNYVRQLYGQPDYNLKLENEEKDGNEATVTGTLFAKSKGKKVTMALEYKFLKKNNRWVVYDVVTDDLSLLENYRAEFNKVIAKESFDALLSKMKKKLSEKS
jgi:phospholipid transport system substrate-binding protein